jgi:arsenate reductase
MTQSILFLCPHSAAKSVIAAAYCQQLASQYGLDLNISFAGTEPDETLSPAVVARLHSEGLDVSHQSPRIVTQQDLIQADWIVSMGCNIGDLAPPGKKIEQWNDVPPPGQDMNGACQSIQDHMVSLFQGMK